MFEQLLAKYQPLLPPLSLAQIALLSAHFELLLKWNKVLNLSAVRSPEEIVERHYCESLFLAGRLPSASLTLGDLGSGGGFPGIPAGILRPECSIALIESHRRKAVFLREATRKLGSFRVLAVRSDSVAESFDCVLSRAVNLEEIGEDLRRIGRGAALLTGSAGSPDIGGFEWQASIQLPWGSHRYLHLGERCFT